MVETNKENTKTLQLQLEDTDANSFGEFFTDTYEQQQQQKHEPKHLQKTTKKRSFLAIFTQILGELFLTAGIILGLFVLWRIWWTNIESNQILDQETIEIQKEFGEKPPVIPAAPQEGEPPAIAPVSKGEPIGIMRIPAFGIDNQTPIKEGTDKAILDQGVFSHYEKSALPGEIGNFATAAHRDIYGARMYHVDKLEKGMPVIIETKEAFLIYKIIDTEIVDPTDVYTVQPDPFISREAWRKDGTLQATSPTRRLLTITTCDPVMVSTHRYIVYAEFEYWTKRGDGMPKELISEDSQAQRQIENLNAANKARNLHTFTSSRSNLPAAAFPLIRQISVKEQ